MDAPKIIEKQQLVTWLEAHPEWSAVKNSLTAGFQFKDFTQAFAFMTEVAKIAEDQNHHPQIINMYNSVTLSLTTHDAGNKITARDLVFAEKVSEIK